MRLRWLRFAAFLDRIGAAPRYAGIGNAGCILITGHGYALAGVDVFLGGRWRVGGATAAFHALATMFRRGWVHAFKFEAQLRRGLGNRILYESYRLRIFRRIRIAIFS